MASSKSELIFHAEQVILGHVWLGGLVLLIKSRLFLADLSDWLVITILKLNYGIFVSTNLQDCSNLIGYNSSE